TAEQSAGTTPSADTVIDQRRLVERLWTEIATLPRPQRCALLLNLRDQQGGSPLLFLPATGIASIRQIAALLDLPMEEFLDLWNRIPLEDREIAERLGVERQQVINLRLAARQRLGRRMAQGLPR